MIRVTCAIIRNEDGEILAVQRGEKTDHPFKWEFPGGKVDEGESEEECIIREIREELSMDIIICGSMESVGYDYGGKQILLIPFICDTLDELPVLTEHAGYRWLSPEALGSVDFLEADIIVAGNYLKEINFNEPGNKVDILPPDEKAGDEEFKAMVNSTMGSREVEWIAASAVENPAIFKKLFDYSFSDDRKLAFHSSWALTKVSDSHPELFINYIPQIISVLNSIDNESTQRSFLRILSLSDLEKITAKEQGILADHCFSAMRSGFSAIAIKAYSMEIIYKLALIYPELSHELAATINMLQGEGSAGVVARGRIILKRLSGNPKR